MCFLKKIRDRQYFSLSFINALPCHSSEGWIPAETVLMHTGIELILGAEIMYLRGEHIFVFET
jgi:hypothetical protein